jgi:hypothetical protein
LSPKTKHPAYDLVLSIVDLAGAGPETICIGSVAAVAADIDQVCPAIGDQAMPSVEDSFREQRASLLIKIDQHRGDPGFRGFRLR